LASSPSCTVKPSRSGHSSAAGVVLATGMVGAAAPPRAPAAIFTTGGLSEVAIPHALLPALSFHGRCGSSSRRRFDFQRVPGDPRLECVEMSLTSGHLRNLGITSPEPKQQDKTLRSAVQRVTQAHPAYAGVEIDRGAGVFRVVRSAGYFVPLVGTPGVRPRGRQHADAVRRQPGGLS